MTEDDQLELIALVNLHGFLIEVMLATECAKKPDGRESLAAMRDAVLDRIENASRPRPGERPYSGVMAEINLRMSINGRRLFQLAEDRRAELAARTS